MTEWPTKEISHQLSLGYQLIIYEPELSHLLYGSAMPFELRYHFHYNHKTHHAYHSQKSQVRMPISGHHLRLRHDFISLPELFFERLADDKFMSYTCVFAQM